MVTDRERELLSWIEENPMMSQQELADRAGITRSSVSVHISNLMKKGMIQGKGYVVQKRPYAVVVGGVNMDIAGYASGEVVPHDSNPGRVEHTAGGVGRNEAHGMRLLGLDVKLVTAFGDDLYAEKLRQNCRDLGIDVKDAITVVNAATSTYLSVVDHRGDPVVGISSMDIYEHLTPALLAQRMGVINRAHTCVVDTNLTEDALRFLADNCRVPLFAETISVAKAHKLRGILDRIDTLKADRLEVQLLLGREPDEKADVEVTARQLLDRGSGMFTSPFRREPTARMRPAPGGFPATRRRSSTKRARGTVLWPRSCGRGCAGWTFGNPPARGWRRPASVPRANRSSMRSSANNICWR